MMPQVSSAFFNWTSTVQMKVINVRPIDFEAQQDLLSVVTFEAVIQAMKPRDVDRKPENERVWKWWDMWSTTKIETNTVVQDPEGLQYRIRGTTDWGQGGFYHTEMTEQPRGL